MKTIIAGTRTFNCYEFLCSELEKSGIQITEVVCGRARGVDMLGARWAREHSIPIKDFPADWKRLGKAAGPIRNAEMAKYADACIVFWDGFSKGTENMIKEAKRKNLKMVIVYV